MNTSSWLPFKLSWDNGVAYTQAIFLTGGSGGNPHNPQFAVLQGTSSVADSHKLHGLLSREALNGYLVYFEYGISNKQVRDPWGYTQMGIVTAEASRRGSVELRRGLWGHDEHSYVLDLNGFARHMGGIQKRTRRIRDDSADIRVGVLFDGIAGRLNFFQVGVQPSRDWVFTDIPLNKNWYAAFATVRLWHVRREGFDRQTVEIGKSLRAPMTLLEFAAGSLIRSLRSQDELDQMWKNHLIPRGLYEFVSSWLELHHQQNFSFSKDMKREVFPRDFSDAYVDSFL